MWKLHVCQLITYVFMKIWRLLFNFSFILCLKDALEDEQILLEGVNELKIKILVLFIFIYKVG